jgi:hypothetical protein
MRKTAILCALAAALLGQRVATNPRPINVDFSEGAIGTMPPGWQMPQPVLDAGYRVELRRGECSAPFAGCVVYLAPRRTGEIRAAELEQSFPAGPYLGKTVGFSASLHMDRMARGDVEIRMRVDYPFGRVEFFDSAEGPVRSAVWQRRHVEGHVGVDAVTISIWARYHPDGLAWVSASEFEGK